MKTNISVRVGGSIELTMPSGNASYRFGFSLYNMVLMRRGALRNTAVSMGDDDQYIREQITRSRLRSTIELAQRLMAGRKDWKGRDYYLHDIDVMELLPPEATDIERKAALLHSTLDTGAATPQELLAHGIEPQVIEILLLVANGPGVTGYGAYVQKCRDIVASKNRAAMRVKLADMLANTGHPANDYTETIELMRAGLRPGQG
jgi:(p)ppGpp synthase/HD superfamily hydrolase